MVVHSDVFVSYRRVDVDFTKAIDQALKATGREVWVDWEDIPPGVAGFTDEIQQGIEGADAFIAILSPSYLESEYCLMELREALRLKKRVIPLVLKKFEPAPAPEGIGHINWIYFTPHAGQENTFEQSFPKVIQALEADNEHSRAHTRFLLRALEWDKSQKNASYLLKGQEISTAETWQVAAISKDPAPTELQSDYILQSRQQQRKQQQQIMAMVVVLLIIAGIAAIIAAFQAVEAKRQEDIAIESQAEAENQAQIALTARAEAEAQEEIAVRQAQEAHSLALSSSALLPGNEAIAVALALEAVRIENPPSQAVSNLYNIAYQPGMRSIFQYEDLTVHNEYAYLSFFTNPAVSPNAQSILIRNRLIDLRTGELIRDFEAAPNLVLSSAFSPDGRTVVMGGDINPLDPTYAGLTEPPADAMYLGLWNVETGELMRRFNMNQGVVRVQISLDGTKMASFGDAGNVTIWDIATGDVLATYQYVEAAISPDFSRIAYIAETLSANANGYRFLIAVYDFEAAEVVFSTEVAHFSSNIKLNFPNNSNELAVMLDNRWMVYSFRGIRSSLSAYFGHTGYITSIAASEAEYASVAEDRQIIIWQNGSGEVLQTLRGHSSNIIFVTFLNPDQIVSLDIDGKIIIWDLRPGDLVVANLFEFADYYPTNVTLHRNNDNSRAVYEDPTQLDTLVLLDMSAEEEIGRYTITGMTYLWQAFFLPDNETVLLVITNSTGGFDLIRYNTRTNESKIYYSGDLNWIALSPDGRTMLVSTFGIPPEFYSFDLETEERNYTLPIEAELMWFVDEGRSFIITEYTTDATLLVNYNLRDTATGEFIRTVIEQAPPADWVLLTPDSRYLITSAARYEFQGVNTISGLTLSFGTNLEYLRLYDFATGDLIRDYGAQGGRLSMNPTGRSFFAESNAGSRVWRLDSLQQAISWVCNNRYVAEFSPEQRQRLNIGDAPSLCETGS